MRWPAGNNTAMKKAGKLFVVIFASLATAALPLAIAMTMGTRLNTVSAFIYVLFPLLFFGWAIYLPLVALDYWLNQRLARQT